MDLFSDEARRNPFPLYDQLRGRFPLFHDPQSNAWIISDYDGVKRALNDPERFNSSLLTADRGNPEWLVFFDPPRQTRLRGLIMQAFTPRAVASLEPRIRGLARQLLEAHIEHGHMDLAADFAVPLPLMVIAEMLGAPPADWPRFRRWSDVILDLSYTITGGDAAVRAAAAYSAVSAEMNGYLTALVQERLAAPADDLITRLAQAEVNGDRLTPKEILGFFQLLLLAGHETTTNLIDNAFLCLMENPDQLARLRASPELLASAIEEVLRFRSPVQSLFRATSCPVEMHGQTIPARQFVLLMIGSANRDPRQFSDADRFDIARDPNPHVAFGHGIHFCIGAPLSRLEARIALPELLNRLDQFELADGGDWEPRKALHVHGPTSLPIRFQPSDRSGTPA